MSATEGGVGPTTRRRLVKTRTLIVVLVCILATTAFYMITRDIVISLLCPRKCTNRTDTLDLETVPTLDLEAVPTLDGVDPVSMETINMHTSLYTFGDDTTIEFIPVMVSGSTAYMTLEYAPSSLGTVTCVLGHTLVPTDQSTSLLKLTIPAGITDVYTQQSILLHIDGIPTYRLGELTLLPPIELLVVKQPSVVLQTECWHLMLFCVYTERRINIGDCYRSPESPDINQILHMNNMQEILSTEWVEDKGEWVYRITGVEESDAVVFSLQETTDRTVPTTILTDLGYIPTDACVVRTETP